MNKSMDVNQVYIKDLKFHLKLILLIVLLTPLIDILNGLLVDKLPVGPGQIVRPLLILYSFCVIAKYSYKNLLFMVAILILLGLSLVFHIHVYGQDIISHIVWDIRIVLTVSLTLLFLTILPRQKLYTHKFITFCEYSIFIISSVIILGHITGIGFTTYNTGVGSKGLFLGQNDITSIISMLFPLVLTQLIINKKYRLLRIVNVICIILSAIFLGTKSAMLSLVIGTGLFFTLIFVARRNVRKTSKKSMLITFIVVISGFIVSGIIIIKKFGDMLSAWIQYQMYFYNNSNDLITYLLSGRNNSLIPMFEVFRENSLFILIGSTFELGQKLISKKMGHDAFVEFDPLSVLFYNGIFVFLIISFIFIYVIRYSLWLLKGNELEKAVFVGLWAGLFNSLLSGHVISSGIAGTYFALMCGLTVYYGKKMKSLLNLNDVEV